MQEEIIRGKELANRFLEVQNLKDQERFEKDVVKLSDNMEELTEEKILEMEDRFSNMSKEELQNELQKMFIMKRKPYVRLAPKIGRNEPCPCGSGKKYKKCCKDQFETYLEARQKDIGDVG